MKRLVQFTAILFLTLSFTACAQKKTIIGVWEIKTNAYQALYEIVEHEDTFFGKVHYYNDGITEYKGKNQKEDYFLTDVILKDGKYINGKMYMPDGSFYKVIFTQKDEDTLEVIMTIDGAPYKETWKRQTPN